MAGKVNVADVVADYVSGLSLPQLSQKYGISYSRARYYVNNAGVLRSRAESVRLSADQGRLGGGFRGKKRLFSDEHKMRMAESRRAWVENNAAGISVKRNGYISITMGPHKGKCVHVAVMEERIGRRLLSDEVVHHIDGNRSNNDISNLALVTKSGHSRLHRFEDALAGKIRRRDKNGRLS